MKNQSRWMQGLLYAERIIKSQPSLTIGINAAIACEIQLECDTPADIPFIEGCQDAVDHYTRLEEINA